MKKCGRLVILSLLCLSVVLLISCAAQKKPALDPDISRSRQFLQAGESQKALDSCSRALEMHPQEKPILEECVRILEDIKKRADSALNRNNFASAEKDYVLLQKNYARFKPIQDSLSFSPASLSRQIKMCRQGSGEKQAQELMRTGDFLKALEFYKAAYAKHDDDATAAAELRKAMEDIKRRADEAVAKGDYVSAGKGYFLLASDYPLYKRLAPSPSYSKDALEEGIKTCRLALTQKGLDLYRKGNLAEAIALWQGILLFDPDNVEIKKAIDTATEQLKKLKK